MIKRGINKKAIESSVLFWWIVGVLTLVLCVVGIIILTKKDSGLAQYVRDIIRFKWA